MAISKRDERVLKDVHQLFATTHDYRGTADAHKSMCKSAMSHAKAVFQPTLADPAGRHEDIGDPLDAPAKGAGGRKRNRLTKAEEAHVVAAQGIADSLAADPDMHRAGKSMMKEARAHLKSVLVPMIEDDPTENAARLVGAISLDAGKSVSPGVLRELRAALNNAKGTRMDDLVIEKALRNGQVTLD